MAIAGNVRIPAPSGTAKRISYEPPVDYIQQRRRGRRHYSEPAREAQRTQQHDVPGDARGTGRGTWRQNYAGFATDGKRQTVQRWRRTS
ncbi:hypothetical protein D3C84_1157290 [compost metagenome]